MAASAESGGCRTQWRRTPAVGTGSSKDGRELASKRIVGGIGAGIEPASNLGGAAESSVT